MCDMLTRLRQNAGFREMGVRFACTSSSLEAIYAQGLRELSASVEASPLDRPILYEGGVYQGCWLESTGTINAEVLARFWPEAAASTYEHFADFQREDGLLPFMITPAGADYTHIQMVTPLARSVWNSYLLQGGQDRNHLSKMYGAMKRFDQWVGEHRNRRGTGCVEAFCVWDTGHDRSPRFWHIPDCTPLGDACAYYEDVPALPYLAPDLTANVYCQRKYLAKMARELGEPESEAVLWETLSAEMLENLMNHCFDERDQFFYDVDRFGGFIRVQSDVLLRVLACEVGDDRFFSLALKKYLLNTRKFFSRFPLTSIAMDDPRFNPRFDLNNWFGMTNFLTLLRAPHAFEHHGRFVELSWIMNAAIAAFSKMTRFSQGMCPWSGEAAYTSEYTPAILCLLDYIERLCGIVPLPSGQLWFTGMTAWAYEGVSRQEEQFAYGRTADHRKFEIVTNATEAKVYRDDCLLYRFPRGIRLVTDRSGSLQGIIGISANAVAGVVEYENLQIPFAIEGNEAMSFDGRQFETAMRPGVIAPVTEEWGNTL
ncbi:hypothetical protein VN24_06305 [Paenibacillus beijingensis]|uniref:Mannosylglycerate hydrolase MGH1-like glycoside hydrolase domain-containing protein n=2 Tax=Paenibacillus beijingensis TaxID=1126833 RepID=A0A0D5NRM1_9BACL|nr:hypothetical protein VN24_06305 [Paenibacillus beijingensis]